MMQYTYKKYIYAIYIYIKNVLATNDLTTVLLRTTLTRTIKLHYYMLSPGSNHLLYYVHLDDRAKDLRTTTSRT